MVDGMAEGALLVAFVTLQRLVELLHARRNTQRLLAEGGIEFGRCTAPGSLDFGGLATAAPSIRFCLAFSSCCRRDASG